MIGPRGVDSPDSHCVHFGIAYLAAHPSIVLTGTVPRARTRRLLPQ